MTSSVNLKCENPIKNCHTKYSSNEQIKMNKETLPCKVIVFVHLNLVITKVLETVVIIFLKQRDIYSYSYCTAKW